MISVASIRFVRVKYDLQISLIADDGRVLAVSTSIGTIAREIAMLGISELHFSPDFSMAIPTNYATLVKASTIDFDEPLAVFLLISECGF